MAPLEIASSATALITCSSTVIASIHKLIRGARHARGEFDLVAQELTSITIVLDLIVEDSNTNITLIPDHLQEQIDGIVNNCAIVVDRLRDMINKFQAGTVVERLQWTVDGKKDVDQYRASLEAHKSALIIAQDTMQWIISKDIKTETVKIRDTTTVIKEDTTAIRLDTEEILAQIDRLRARLPRDSDSSQLDTDFILNRYLDSLSDNLSVFGETPVQLSTPNVHNDAKDGVLEPTKSNKLDIDITQIIGGSVQASAGVNGQINPHILEQESTSTSESGHSTSIKDPESFNTAATLEEPPEVAVLAKEAAPYTSNQSFVHHAAVEDACDINESIVSKKSISDIHKVHTVEASRSKSGPRDALGKNQEMAMTVTKPNIGPAIGLGGGFQPTTMSDLIKAPPCPFLPGRSLAIPKPEYIITEYKDFPMVVMRRFSLAEFCDPEQRIPWIERFTTSGGICTARFMDHERYKSSTFRDEGFEQVGILPLVEACRIANLPWIEFLLVNGAEVNSSSERLDSTPKRSETKISFSPLTASLVAASGLHYQSSAVPRIIELLFQYGLDPKHKVHTKALDVLLASREEESTIALLKTLMSYGISPSIGNPLWSCIMQSASNSDGSASSHYITFAGVLLENGADINNSFGDGNGLGNFLKKAAHRPEYALRTVKLFFNQGLVATGDSIAVYTCIKEAGLASVRSELLQLLIDNKVDLDSSPEEGISPLYLSIKQSMITEAKTLIHNGAHVGRYPRNGMSTLQLAMNKNFFDIFSLLLEKGADPNSFRWESESALYLATSGSYASEYLRTLINHGALPNKFQYGGCDPLYRATQWCDYTKVDILLKGGAKAGGLTRRNSPLLVAVRRNQLRIAKALLESGAHPDKICPEKDHKSCSPLWVAVNRGYVSIVQLLLQHGASKECVKRSISLAGRYISVPSHYMLEGRSYTIEEKSRKEIKSLLKLDTELGPSLNISRVAPIDDFRQHNGYEDCNSD